MGDILRLENLCAGYGAASIISDISLTVVEGRATALLGRNGVGKTTLIDSIVGVTRRQGGSIHIAGRDVTRLSPEKRAAAGVGWVPQERNIFKSLTVVENLTAVARPGHWTVPRVFDIFPRLAERKSNLGSQLSGGEQQMLAIARALMLNPKLLLLDEPTEGLAPIVVEELLRVLTRLFRRDGMSGIIVEQHAQKILGMTDNAVILERGRIVHQGTSASLLADTSILDRHLGIGQ
jgi:branched-chain amino acid transport system ATP-binding protein